MSNQAPGQNKADLLNFKGVAALHIKSSPGMKSGSFYIRPWSVLHAVKFQFRRFTQL